jgi:hypothetical protein
MNITYTTEIDTLSLQLNFNNDNNQRIVLIQILDYIRKWFNAYIHQEYYYIGFDNRIEYKVYCNGRTVVSFITGYSHGSFFIKIRFAGLKTYDTVVDAMSYSYLMAIVAYLNTNGIIWTLSELDIAIDMIDVNFNNILAVCTTKTSRTMYHRLGKHQIYNGETTYIEEFTSAHSKTTAIKRSYFYNKRVKERIVHNNEIGFNVQRFEVKLQSPYFLKYGFDINVMQNTLNMYHLMYFEDIHEKNNLIDRYNNHKSPIRKREIERWGFEEYRLYFDTESISNFITFLSCIDNYFFFGENSYLMF